MKNNSISVILPFYKEENLIDTTVEETYKFLERTGRDYEIILIIDGVDDTFRKAKDLKQQYPNIRVDESRKKRGYGRAIIEGINLSEKDLIFFMDGDGQFSIQDLGKFLGEIPENDMVIGYRQKREDRNSRILVSSIFNRLVCYFTNIDFKDVNCGFKLFKSEIVEDKTLESNEIIDVELLARSHQKWDIKELPVEHRRREEGESQAKGVIGVRLSLIINSLRDLWIIRKNTL